MFNESRKFALYSKKNNYNLRCLCKKTKFNESQLYVTDYCALKVIDLFILDKLSTCFLFSIFVLSLEMHFFTRNMRPLSICDPPLDWGYGPFHRL